MFHGILLLTARVWRTEQQEVQVYTLGQDLGEQVYHTTDEKLMAVRMALDFRPSEGSQAPRPHRSVSLGRADYCHQQDVGQVWL